MSLLEQINDDDMRRIRVWCQRSLWHRVALPSCEFHS